MTIEQIARAKKIENLRGAKILVLDIETAPILHYSFGLWGQNIGINQIVDDDRVLGVGAKWYGTKAVMWRSEHSHGRVGMLEWAWQLVDQADIIVHYNGNTFDMKHLQKEFWLEGMTRPRPHKNVDLLRVVKKEFRFSSNKLDWISQRAGIGQKVKHEGFALWRGCLDGDPSAWARMGRYCRGDVKLTEALYDELRPWIRNHPHFGIDGPLRRCTACGSENLTRDGYHDAIVIRRPRFRCDHCGNYLIEGYHTETKRSATTRGI